MKIHQLIVPIACFCLVAYGVAGCEVATSGRCNDVDLFCTEFCHMIDICPNAAGATLFNDDVILKDNVDCVDICRTELGDTGFGSWVAGTYDYCLKQASCGFFDGDLSCFEDLEVAAGWACDGSDWLLTLDGCTERIDCPEFCLKMKHEPAESCGKKTDDGPEVCICGH